MFFICEHSDGDYFLYILGRVGSYFIRDSALLLLGMASFYCIYHHYGVCGGEFAHSRYL